MKSPDEQVAEIIITELKKLGLLTDATLDKLKPKLINGTLRSVDWKVAFETDRLKSGETK